MSRKFKIYGKKENIKNPTLDEFPLRVSDDVLAIIITLEKLIEVLDK